MSENCLYFNNLNVFDKNGISYCVDMLRLKTSITVNDFEKYISNRLFIYKNNIETWTSSRICDFFNNYNYSDENCSFWFGFISNKEKSISSGSNMQNDNKKFNLTVEFNPNKVKNNKLLLNILSITSNWFVKSVDFALDIKTNILNIIGFDKSKKKSLITYDNGGDNKTYYIGKGNNRVKIYNKKIENELNYDLTRIELTRYFGESDSINIIKNWKYDGYFPELYLKDYQIEINDLEENKTLMALIFAVNSGLSLHELTPYYRRNVKNFLKKKKPIEVDFSLFSVVLFNYLCYYFCFLD